MESSEWRNAALQEVRNSLPGFLLTGETLWPKGQERLPQEAYPAAFVKWIDKGGGTLQKWPEEVKPWCERLAHAWDEFPRLGVRIASAMTLGSRSINNSLWDGVALALGEFLREFGNQQDLTYPGHDRLEGTNDPFATLKLAPEWRRIRGHLVALERFMQSVDVDSKPTKSTSAIRKRSSENGAGREKLIGALTLHHKYADGGCLNLEPVGCNQLARLAKVSPSTASAFFDREFKGYKRYRVVCRNGGTITDSLKALNNEFMPHDLYGRRPPDESDSSDGDL